MEKRVHKEPQDLIANLAWGTHGCHFYKTQKDLLDVLVPYFRAGLLNNEFCIWVTSKPLGIKTAFRSLKRALPKLDSFLERGQLEIHPHADWYGGNGPFESRRVLTGWIDKCNEALAKGYEGLRLTGDALWLNKTTWKEFTDYEAALDKTTSKARIKALCTYALDKCQAGEIIDVVKNHGYTLIKRGEWELIENAQRQRAEQEALQKAMGELDRMVQARTAELRASREQLRALAAHLQTVREEERRSIARELHDEIGQALTAIKLSFELPRTENFDANVSQALASINELIGRVRDLSLELRPAMLDDLGLLAALKWHIDRYSRQVKIQVDFKYTGLNGQRFDMDIETAAYRIVQEALTNVARHAGVDRVEVNVEADNKILRISIKDHGTGFDPNFVSPSSAMGISGMRERAMMLGGRLEIESVSGTGTLLRAELPLGKSTGKS
jgi:signal transduction histidine kinase